MKAARGAARIPGGATQHQRAARGGRGAALALSAVTRCVTSIPEPRGCRRRHRDLAALLVCQSRRGACRPLLGTPVPPPPAAPRFLASIALCHLADFMQLISRALAAAWPPPLPSAL